MVFSYSLSVGMSKMCRLEFFFVSVVMIRFKWGRAFDVSCHILEKLLGQPRLLYLDDNFLRVILDFIVGRKSHLENSKVLEEALILLLARLIHEGEQKRERA